jgi:TolB protein
MNADGTDKRQLTRDTLESESPAWSPDGTRIVYTLDDYAGSSDIYVMDADGTNKRRLTRDGNAGSAAWSPDGKQIVFSHHVHGGGSDLYVMTVPDGAGTAGSHEVQLTQMGQKGALDPSWSPDGTHIVCVVDADPDPQSWELTLRVLNVQQALRSGGVSIAAMQALPRVGSSLNDRPAWSPTGSQIAFSAVVGGRRDIYVANADGTDLRQITETPDFDELDPAWSPDGTKIVFQANPDAQWDIYVMNADGSHRRRLTTDVANDTAPSWAP